MCRALLAKQVLILQTIKALRMLKGLDMRDYKEGELYGWPFKLTCIIVWKYAPQGEAEDIETWVGGEEHGVVMRLSSVFGRKGASPFSCIAAFLGHTTFYTDYLPAGLIDGGVKIGQGELVSYSNS